MYQSRKRNVPEWRGGMDWRVVCSCQLHSRKRNVWRRSLRYAARGAALLFSIPLAFAAIDIPTAAMNMNLPLTQTPPLAQTAPQSQLRIISDAAREQFLNPQVLTLDVFKEDYFRTHVPYGAIIYREARRNDLPPELVAAMVHTESDFRPRLVSDKSAQGLMQIIPSTARILGIDDDPFNPEKNIAAGTKYFRYLLDRFEDEQIALAPDTAGEGNVARFGGIPPFAETRDYISKVTRRTRRYRDGFRNTYIAEARMRRALH
jgi:soluble lytic murein transglycosylase-like protein